MDYPVNVTSILFAYVNEMHMTAKKSLYPKRRNRLLVLDHVTSAISE